MLRVSLNIATVASILTKRLLSTSCSLQNRSPLELSYTVYDKTKGDPNTPPVLILHGLFGSKSNWNSLSKAFQQKTNPTRKIYSIDARNHGESPHSPVHSYEHMVDDLVALYQKLDIEKASVIGHSMGGRAMMLLALKHPHLVDRAVIVDISPASGLGTSNTNIPLFLQSMKSIKISPDQTIHQARKIADEQLMKIIAEKPLRDFLITNLAKSDEDGTFRWRINLESLESNFNDGVARFPDVSGLSFGGPTLFIAGGRSDYIKKSDIPIIRQLFPKSNITYVEGAGHWVHSEKSAEFASLVLEFLNAKD
ncbi:protein ABHD11-like [Toxorhynchites rutilus septentrionalis]|uniref:protein ABHD11-like n=1 Tax=Toxorhynchites rutilus septentrionalis TaxID=329112 RepID=UPI00247B13BB|nr:protein ABHD11-like [Toxorhynchites rutilus septentrionalis]